MRRTMLLLVVGLWSCSTAVTSMRDQIRDLDGHSADDVIRALGRPTTRYSLPESRHVVFVYDAQRTDRGRSALAAAGLMLSGVGSGLSGQAPMAKPHPAAVTACRFELELGDDGRLVAVTERGDGC